MEEECQICLLQKPMLYTPCKHCACKHCLERVLFSTLGGPFHNATDTEFSVDTDEMLQNELLSCPGWGRCPFCRRVINMYEIRKNKDLSGEVYPKNIDVWGSELAGLLYKDRENTMRIEFPSSDNDLPTLCLLHKNRDISIPFEDGFHYNRKIKTFYGNVNMSKVSILENLKERWEIVMQLSSDLRYVMHGTIVKIPKQVSSENFFKTYPLAGKWTIRWRHRDEEDRERNDLQKATITVKGNSFSCFGFEYEINLGNADEGKVHFHWPSSNVKQVLEEGVDLTAKPEGPEVGETIVWSVPYTPFACIYWTRETKEMLQPLCRIQKLGHRHTLLHKIEQGRQNQKPSYHGDSPWQNTFIQAGTVGVASYHFISKDGTGENGVYISYEHVMCSNWPSLDDGTPVPARVPFKDISYDEESRTFRGTIAWHDMYGTSWNGDNCWKYKMVFDSEFLCIASGHVQSINIDGIESIKSSYGESLVYINAGIVEKLKLVEGNNEREVHNADVEFITEEEEVPNNATSFLEAMWNRLNAEGVSREVLRHLIGFSRQYLNSQEDSIDYNL